MRKFKEELDKKCLDQEPAFCTAACPFHLDVRDLITKLQRGSVRSAYRQYAQTVAFPQIVAEYCDHPCEGVCIRKDVDSAIRLSLMERSIVALAPDRKPNNYFMPPKEKKIAIIGGGLSGLGCALKCCWQKYQVDVYEATDRLGGSLWEKDPSGSFLEEIQNQFQFEKPVFHMNTRVTDLSMLSYDAVYIATGADGDAFGTKLSGQGAFATETPGVFRGGQLEGCSLMEALSDGLEVIYAIERYVKTGLMNHPYREKGTKLTIDTAAIRFMPAKDPEAKLLDKDGLKAEAERCLKCRCDVCLRGCDLMNYYQKFPRRIEEEVEITIHPGTLSGDGTVATRLIATCNHCGRCKTVCPQGIDVGKFLLANHNIMRQKGAMPWVFHEFWLRDMEFSMQEASLLMIPKESDVVKQLFFPGCRLGGSLPELIPTVYAALLKAQPSTGLYLSCCGLPAAWAGEEDLQEEILENFTKVWENLGKPEVLLACESCRKNFRERLSQIPTRSIYSYLAAHRELLPQQKEPSDVCGSILSDEGTADAETEKTKVDAGAEARKFAIFDPCAVRNQPEDAEAVRNLISLCAPACGIEAEELPRHGKLSSCCSFGGHTAISNPHYTDEVLRARSFESEAPYLVYCANCRDVFEGYGKPAVHILDLLFGTHPDPQKKAPTPSESRENRRVLKETLLKAYAPSMKTIETAETKSGTQMEMKAREAERESEITPETASEKTIEKTTEKTARQDKTSQKSNAEKLLIPDELLEKLGKDRILVEDIARVIDYCEETGRKVYEEETGVFSGHRMIGCATFWVSYRQLENGKTELVNAYWHRMKITERGDHA